MERLISRNDFGPGEAGKWAFEIIESGARCEAQKDGWPCGHPAIQTVDTDVLGNYEPFPVCGEECASLVRTSIQEELEQQGRSTVFGRNGWGRA